MAHAEAKAAPAWAYVHPADPADAPEELEMLSSPELSPPLPHHPPRVEHETWVLAYERVLAILEAC